MSKKQLYFSALVVIIVFLGTMLFQNTSQKVREESINLEESSFNPNSEMSEWQIFTLAIIDVESGSNPNAIGKRDDVGILQITPIYVDEVNRIQSRTRFTLEDRFDIEKSLDMFGIMNYYKNPDMCVEEAIRIHNPKAPYSYKLKILNRMDEIRAGEPVNEEIKAIVCRYNQK